MKTIEDPNKGKKEEDKSLFTEEERLRSQLSNSEWFLRRYGNQLFHLQSVQYNIIRNVDSLSATESLDSLHPFDMDFFIDPDVQEVISTKLAFRIKPYRAYSKSVANSQQLTSSDGGATTTASGGGTTTSSGGGATTSSGGSTSPVSSVPREQAVPVTEIQGYIKHSSPLGWLIEDYNGNPKIAYRLVSGNHTHIVFIPSHTHTVGNHTHSVGNHTHSISSHNHTIPAHNHDMTFGIYEKTPTSPSVNVYLSNNGYDFDVFLGTYTADEEIEFGTKIRGTGWKVVRFEGNQLMRITAYLILKSDIKVG